MIDFFLEQNKPYDEYLSHSDLNKKFSELATCIVDLGSGKEIIDILHQYLFQGYEHFKQNYSDYYDDRFLHTIIDLIENINHEDSQSLLIKLIGTMMNDIQFSDQSSTNFDSLLYA